MTRQRHRKITRTPTEETVRLSLASLIGDAGTVDSERHKYDWREDDLLIWVRLKQPVSDSDLPSLRRMLADRMNSLLPANQPLHDWLVVIEFKGQTISTVAWHEDLHQSPKSSA